MTFQIFALAKWEHTPSYNQLHLNGREIFTPITQLSISQTEGQVAIAKLTFAHTQKSNIKEIYDLKIIAITKNKKIIFQGLRHHFEKHHNAHTLTTFIATPPNLENQLELAISKASHSFVSQEIIALFTNKTAALLKASHPNSIWSNKLASYTNALEFTPYLLNFCPSSGFVSLSNYFKGKFKNIIHANYTKDSLKICLRPFPIHTLTIHLTANWLQKLEGSLDVWPKITKANNGSNVLATYTPSSLTKYWPKIGQKVGIGKKNSGFIVDKSEINVINPMAFGSLPKAPLALCSGELQLFYHYQQPRSETLTIKTNNENQICGKQHEININFNIPQTTAANFFDTPKAKTTIKAALQLAKNYICTSMRSLEIQITTPYFDELILNTDTQVAINLPPYYGLSQTIEAKIKKWHLSVCKSQQLVHFTLAFTPQDSFQNKIKLLDKTKVNQVLGIKEEQLSEDKLINVQIINDSTTQSNLLQNSIPPNPQESLGTKEPSNSNDPNAQLISNILSCHPTILNFELLDLRNTATLERTLYCEYSIN